MKPFNAHVWKELNLTPDEHREAKRIARELRDNPPPQLKDDAYCPLPEHCSGCGVETFRDVIYELAGKNLSGRMMTAVLQLVITLEI